MSQNRQKFPPVSDEYIAEVISHTKDVFVPGIVNGDIFLAELDCDYSNIHPVDFHSCCPDVVSVKDDNFIGMVNLLPGTNFVASTGPKHHEMENFFANTIYNEKCYIDEVVALSNKIGSKPGLGEFYNYGLTERRVPYRYGNSSNQIEVRVKKICGNVRDEGFTYSPDGFVQVELTVTSTKYPKPRKLIVNFIEVIDGEGLDITNDKLKDLLFKILEKSYTKKIMIHCSAGVGRTGHFVLALEILRYYEKIYLNTPSLDANKKINQLLDGPRSVRPQLAYNPYQYDLAIKNSNTLYKYDYEKKLREEKENEKRYAEFWADVMDLVKPELKVQQNIPSSDDVIININIDEFKPAEIKAGNDVEKLLLEVDDFLKEPPQDIPMASDAKNIENEGSPLQRLSVLTHSTRPTLSLRSLFPSPFPSVECLSGFSSSGLDDSESDDGPPRACPKR